MAVFFNQTGDLSLLSGFVRISSFQRLKSYYYNLCYSIWVNDIFPFISSILKDNLNTTTDINRECSVVVKVLRLVFCILCIVVFLPCVILLGLLPVFAIAAFFIKITQINFIFNQYILDWSFVDWLYFFGFINNVRGIVAMGSQENLQSLSYFLFDNPIIKSNQKQEEDNEFNLSQQVVCYWFYRNIINSGDNGHHDRDVILIQRLKILIFAIYIKSTPQLVIKIFRKDKLAVKVGYDMI